VNDNRCAVAPSDGCRDETQDWSSNRWTGWRSCWRLRATALWAARSASYGLVRLAKCYRDQRTVATVVTSTAVTKTTRKWRRRLPASVRYGSSFASDSWLPASFVEGRTHDVEPPINQQSTKVQTSVIWSPRQATFLNKHPTGCEAQLAWKCLSRPL